MSLDNRSRLTPKDHRVLTQLHTSSASERLAAQIRRKLDLASIVPAEEMPDDVVTLGSRVLFRTAAGFSGNRTLIASEDFATPGMTLSVSTPLGLVLLGMAEGEVALVERASGDRVAVAVDAVAYQPEAVARVAWGLGRSRSPHPPTDTPESRRSAVPILRSLCAAAKRGLPR